MKYIENLPFVLDSHLNIHAAVVHPSEIIAACSHHVVREKCRNQDVYNTVISNHHQQVINDFMVCDIVTMKLCYLGSNNNSGLSSGGLLWNKYVGIVSW